MSNASCCVCVCADALLFRHARIAQCLQLSCLCSNCYFSQLLLHAIILLLLGPVPLKCSSSLMICKTGVLAFIGSDIHIHVDSNVNSHQISVSRIQRVNSHNVQSPSNRHRFLIKTTPFFRERSCPAFAH